ncbi:MAG: macro domain-containing protein [Armatimonadota bacterium]|nr:macro domain-containing protein [bacterium]MDW8320603.1 macro domain-containing protein [Armatimonadota bacterium]
MIRFVRGNILDSDADALVNTVNTVGIMGKGIALQFKQRFPENYLFYREACERGEVVPGKVLVFRTDCLQPRYIINFPTKRHWRHKSRLEDIADGLEDLVKRVRELGISSIAIPALGCGHGGLDWADVRPLIENTFANLPEIKVDVYEPAANQPEAASSRTPARLKPAHAALLLAIHQYSQIEPETTLRDIHHIAYLLSSVGILSFRKQRSGFRLKGTRLFSPAVERLVRRLSPAYLERRRGYRRKLLFAVTEEAVEQARSVLQRCPKVQSKFERIGGLLEGHESSLALQLLALVIYHRKDTVFGQSLEHLLENRAVLFPSGRYPRNGVFVEQIRTIWESVQQAEGTVP